jgi:hypothetical protein
VEVFVFAVEAEPEAMDRERVGVPRHGRKPDLSLRRRLIGLMWTACVLQRLATPVSRSLCR